MSAQHTPGPWCVEDPMDFELTIVEAGKETHEWRFIASCSLPDGDDDQDFTSGEVQANARLIAAAPELLEALRPFAAVMADIGETEADEDTFRNANRAYAKAPAITVGDIRKAAALFSLATGESK